MTQIMFAEGIRPKYLIVDQGPEFKCEYFENTFCKALSILPRLDAVGKHDSIAVVERIHRTIKEILRRITLPEDRVKFERELRLAVDWYNEHSPFAEKTPNEVDFSRPAANEQPRIS